MTFLQAVVPMTNASANKMSLTEQVYEQIKHMIVYGQLRPGEALSVGEMAERFNVSKTPVREAFNALKHDGLIEILPYKGCIVSQLNFKDMGELFTLRVLLEGGAAELAAIHATDQTLKTLDELIETHARLLKTADEVQIMKLNFEFHVAIAEASNNLRLKKMVTNILDKMQRVLYLDLKIGSHFSLNDHIEIAELIKRKDAAGAKQLMIDHVNSTRHRVFSAEIL